MKRILALTLAVLMSFITLCFAGCGSKKEQTDLEYVKSKGKLVVGITDYKPMNYKDENGNWIGFDTELTEAFCKKIGVEPEFVVLANWGGKFTELSAKSIDCAWNGMTITEEALKNSSVSNPYIKNSQVVILSAKAADNHTTVESLKDLTFAVEDGSAGQTQAEENGLKSIAVDDQAKALFEVKSGSCDGCIIDKTMADSTVGAGTSYSDLAVALTLGAEKFGISFRKDSDITAELNKFLDEYKASGELAKLAEKYNVELY